MILGGLSCLSLLCFVSVFPCHLVSPWEYSEICANLTLISESGPGASRAFGKILTSLDTSHNAQGKMSGHLRSQSVAKLLSTKENGGSVCLPTSGSASCRGLHGHSL